ncbi:unnamed protein product [Blepharisma stoltei]|uniref:RING-type E3 ubiquitin transferase n=1 Tax=Blepharisma stoltei TaxID=1481888 RepID=A0AAU9IA90_9CILI|nr:unnamed protein product [Blepharisma stoltei]
MVLHITILIYCLLLCYCSGFYTYPSNSSDSSITTENTIQESGSENYSDLPSIPETPSNSASVVGLVLGILILVVGGAIWGYFEWNYQITQKFLNKCLNVVIDAPPIIDSGNNGKLIFVAGNLQVGIPFYLQDPFLPIVTVSEALLLKRQVEMYQWQEETIKDGLKAIDYKHVWARSQINSSHFKSNEAHHNPDWDPKLQNATFSCQPEAFIGPYRMSREILKKIPIREKLRLVHPTPIYDSLNKYIIYYDDTYYYLTTQEAVEGEYKPGIGDYRIKYSVLHIGTAVSILGAQDGDTLTRYEGKLLTVESGIISADKLLERKLSNRRTKQYIIRIFSTLLLLIGFILAT